jgi:hypothetical protein
VARVSVAVLYRSRPRWLERSRDWGLACANLCFGFAETDPGSFNNTVAEKQVSSWRHFGSVPSQ